MAVATDGNSLRPGAPPPPGPRHRAGELANIVTHGVGLVAALVGAAVLIVLAALHGEVRDVVGFTVFGASLVLLYGASTFYHAARRPALKARLRVLDHAAIYLLIAGTYTPFLIGAVGGAWGWSLFGVIWGLAMAGVAFKLAFTGRFRVLSTSIYLGMGWLAVVAAGPLIRHLSPATLAWLVAGGLAYTLGTPVYHSRRWRHAHAAWHVFVMAGSACHAVAVGTLL